MSTKETKTDTTDPRVFEPHIDASAYLPFAPNSANSIPLPPDRQELLNDVLALYGSRPSEQAMNRYAEKAVYDDPFSFCDTRYKIAGQWYGLPMIFQKTEPKEWEVVRNEKDEIVIKLRQVCHYFARGVK
jgi:hypothetical protein